MSRYIYLYIIQCPIRHSSIILAMAQRDIRITNLQAIGLLDETLTITSKYFRRTSLGRLALQNGSPQLDWQRIETDLLPLDPSVSLAGQRHMYQDAVKHVRAHSIGNEKTEHRSLKPTDFFTVPQLKIIQHMIDTHFSPLRQRIMDLESQIVMLQQQLQQQQRPKKRQKVQLDPPPPPSHPPLPPVIVTDLPPTSMNNDFSLDISALDEYNFGQEFDLFSPL